ncbi:hypothetical protein IFM89_030502 [Coptis chinensis]|uniref:Uncharacterized protein n=1 Tax=Coptis chinensis TaxID=261450 RepID=A0A835HCJ1_9MAGN|nr:hypothetical protein IFM89_030502 [Coptis chinensis]
MQPVKATPLACSSSRANPTCRGLRTYESTVFGPTCDALDRLLTGFQLRNSGERPVSVSQHGSLHRLQMPGSNFN